MAEYFDISQATRAVLSLSLKADGNKIFRIDGTPSNFKVSEFRCWDGSDQILIDTALVIVLQRIRSYFGEPVYINSAYRTASWNKKVGGAAGSQHLLGKAADIRRKANDLADNLKTLQVAEKNGAHGLGLYGDFVHVDVRDGRGIWTGSGATKTNCIQNGSFLP